ncbi:MAG: SPFH domain-containing protein [Candidatus Acidiferrales bacterium]
MLFLRFLLLAVSFGFLACAAGVVLYDIYLAFELGRLLHPRKPSTDAAQSGQPAEGIAAGPSVTVTPRPPRAPRTPGAIRWNVATKLVLVAAVSAFVGKSIIVVPDGEAAIRVSQISGVRPGTFYPGTHLIFPLTERVVLFDTRDKVFQTASAEGPHEKLEVLTVEAREGLEVGLAITVRYRVDPQHLDYIQANLAQPVDEEIVAPVVTSVFRELAPNYVVRDLFSTKREEFRSRAAQAITARLGSDSIVVKEVLLRKVQLPEEYAKGLEGLLMKEQEDDRTLVDADIEQKRVKIAESQAEAAKVRQVKHAEADAASRVIMAKSESDSMQYTLPLKQKQIEQSRLEAEARKEATIQNAEAEAQARVKTAEAEAQAKVIDSKADQQRSTLLSEVQNIQTIKNAEAVAQAKVIDGKAESERNNLLADSEAHGIRVKSQAEAEELELQAAALKTNPLLVQYTVAQRLSDRVQIMMVPNDGKFFFTNDVLKSVGSLPDASGRPGSK